MTIRTRLILLFTAITATILLVFALVVYYSASDSREKAFYGQLSKEAITKANLILNARVTPDVLQDIYRSNREVLEEVEVAIYNQDFTLIYHDAVEIDFVKETPEMLQQILTDGKIRFTQEGWQVIGLSYAFQDENYIVTAAAYDEYGIGKLNSLFNSMIWIFIVSIAFIGFSGIVFSKKALAPVMAMTAKARQISATSLDLRLPTGKHPDELQELADTINNLLHRLEQSFDAQKQFVSNISHELRTPLAAIISELEWAIEKRRTEIEYQKTLSETLKDAQKLVRLSNSLLDLAKASYDPTEITFKEVRADELLLEARKNLIQAHPEFQIAVAFAHLDDDSPEAVVYANAYLLQTAFSNLIENACKFSSNKTCNILIEISKSNQKQWVKIDFRDTGPGIPQADQTQIFNPFFRGANETLASGNGIGLSLVQKIVHIHKGKLAFSSNPSGTLFSISLPLTSGF